jgi:hypothetical protein
MKLSNNPQNVNDDVWYYEEKKGILIYANQPGDFPIFIPWEMLKKSLARKNYKKPNKKK